MTESDPQISWRLDRVDAQRMKTLALLLGDPNPIHLDGRAAADLGLADKPVNQGPSTIAFIYNMFEAEVPNARVKKLKSRLLGNVLADQEILVTATRTAHNTAVDEYDVEVIADGVTVIKATAELESMESTDG